MAQTPLQKIRTDFFAAQTRYEYLSTLGYGGMGAVFKVRDRELDADLAIKVMLRGIDLESSDALTRFKREIQLNRKIKHPNVARIFDFGIAASIPYVTMEYVTGKALSAIIKEEKRIPASRLVPMLRQIALGTHEAHKAGIIHRDLKPQNIMVDESGAIAILDFGLAREFQSAGITRDGNVLGTPFYMAPELARGEGPSLKCDIWAIGVVAFQALTGQLPFEGSTPLGTFMAILSNQLPLEKLQEEKVPGDVIKIVARCLEKNPADRYTSAEELATDLALADLEFILSFDLPEADTRAEPAPQPPPRQEPPAAPAAPERKPVTPQPWMAVPAAPAPPPDTPARDRALRPSGEEATRPFVTPRQTPRAEAVPTIVREALRVPPPPPSKPSQPRILLVDDDETYRTMMRVRLESTGCQVLEAQNGEHALSVLHEHTVDLVLMDVLMPKLDGFDTTRILKSQGRFAKLPVILMSAFSERGRLAFAIQSGATDFVPKQQSLSLSLERIWRLLEVRGFAPPPSIQALQKT